LAEEVCEALEATEKLVVEIVTVRQYHQRRGMHRRNRTTRAAKKSMEKLLQQPYVFVITKPICTYV
jgi:uncharacterized protein YbaP (TraB family)